MTDPKSRSIVIDLPLRAGLAWALTAALLAAGSGAARADEGRSGQDVVVQVCAACHASGALGAPRIGDRKAWAPRYARGLSSLQKSALEGVRSMPSHGGQMSLTDLEIERAITYMVNQSGGHWTEPIDRTKVPAARTGPYVFATQCAKCHAEGVGGAPRVGDAREWIRRAHEGFDTLVRSAIAGHGGMPPRGGEADLTDSEVRAAVTYMFQTSVARIDSRGGKSSPGAAK